jgi:hypothetical protein
MLPWLLYRNFPAIIYLCCVYINLKNVDTHIFNYRKLYFLMFQEISFTLEKII